MAQVQAVDRDLHKYGARVLWSLQASGARVATKYISPKKVIRATRRRHKPGLGAAAGTGFARDTLEITLIVGRPNYAEREFIGWCTRAGKKFPIKNIIHKFPGVRRAKRK